MLVVKNLVKQYGDFTAADDISFEAGKGTVFGLLGPNGAGKSTTINCISTSEEIALMPDNAEQYASWHVRFQC